MAQYIGYKSSHSSGEHGLPNTLEDLLRVVFGEDAEQMLSLLHASK